MAGNKQKNPYYLGFYFKRGTTCQVPCYEHTDTNNI